MREIKFRAWDKENKRMSESFNIAQPLIFNLRFKPTHDILTTPNKKEYIYLQYTGLKDKNGKESYFQDLIKMWDTDIFEIRWDSIMGRVFLHNLNKKGDSLYLYGSDIKNGEVIGNIYENKELLNESI